MNVSHTIESEITAENTLKIAALLDQLADELMNVNETLGETVIATDSAANPIVVDSLKLLALLKELDEALAHGELAESVLKELSSMLPKSDFDSLDQTVNSFDFEAAREIVSKLHDHYSKQGNTKGNAQ
jgi:hypothetical protein